MDYLSITSKAVAEIKCDKLGICKSWMCYCACDCSGSCHWVRSLVQVCYKDWCPNRALQDAFGNPELILLRFLLHVNEVSTRMLKKSQLLSHFSYLTGIHLRHAKNETPSNRFINVGIKWHLKNLTSATLIQLRLSTIFKVLDIRVFIDEDVNVGCYVSGQKWTESPAI